MYTENNREFVYQERRSRVERRKKLSRRASAVKKSHSGEQRDDELKERRTFCRRM
ncbi:MAG: hypothetical protein HQL69_22080 [Magnetococcales bacterium]|nr:hypothetical protein [Magnetococcales bacterium]